MIDIALLEYLESFLTPRRLGLNKKVISQRTNHFTVAIEDVYQLHNTSAVIRSCDVFGIQNVHVIEEINAKRIDREIAMGSQKWVDVNRYKTTKACVTHLKKNGYQIVATTPQEHSITLEEFNINTPSVFFFGQEQQGLSDMVINSADVLLHIPMIGFTESLNISVSAAIILQRLTYKLRNSTILWQLSEEEQLLQRMNWAKKVIKSHDQIIARYYEKE